KNARRELKTLTFKKDKNGKLILDEFNIDPHSFSALWYALDGYEVPDLKRTTNGFSKSRLGL
ncbi:TPA: terminase large subunit, partial [Streptococcus agalactiae]